MVEYQARNNLIDFCIATNPKYKPNWHHCEIAKELEKAEANTADWKILIIQVPPRFGKSELASINFPAWFLGRNPNKEIITASYSAELALDFGSKTRNLVSGEVFNHIFPTVKLREDAKSKQKWNTSKGGSYTSVGIGGPITGRGADILDIDDPIKNAEEAASEIIREKHWQWFLSTAYTRLEPNGKVILILTRWHLDDLAGRILKNEEFKILTKVISFPAIAIRDEKFRKLGEPLWPERYSLAELESIRRSSGPYIWNSLYQQNPILSENQEFRQSWIRKVDAKSVDNQITRNFLTIDTAISKQSGADFTGICDNAVDTNNKWNLRAWRQRIDPKELIDLLFILHDRRSYEKIGIEKTIYLQAIQPFLEEEMVKRNRYLPIVELEHKQMQKELRIRGLIPRYAAGSINHVDGECGDLEEEMFQFPLGLHDDVIDSTAYQVQLAERAYDQNVLTTQVHAQRTQNDIYAGI